ncbi:MULTISPECIES: sensor domain-containing diguanylate cyclase [unclassified Agarivorans]|uniref:sensor domain-containing diguanylate cyclase n=1 Tax=unclassified Agarivorans TaxID=2636026 RepID=UPI0026E3B587|nr:MULTISPECIES: sensor domain-containing diguanylate cyclase [unclassified Agarivorans]MDO6687797.1 sensor domain-containing diguanylate cyclase [Agarivorans sp. 3_MG-2023]MDO6717339.1 sensor domain-containing diguanylate cyclase [Agarivorans sp. 2_MG-2023]
MKQSTLLNSWSWKKRASLWALLVTLLFSAVVSHRYHTVKHQIDEEVELSFRGFSTANKHLVSLLSQRLSLLTRTLGLLNYVNDENELTLVSLATEWQRIAKDVNLEGNFYYIHRDGRVDLVLDQNKQGHELKWNSEVNPLITNYFKELVWRGEGVISSKALLDRSSNTYFYLLYIPVFDKWSKLVGWMVNEYDQQAINQTVHFVGRPQLVERAIILTEEGVIIEGDYSKPTYNKLIELVGRIDYELTQSYFLRDDFVNKKDPYSVSGGLMFTKETGIEEDEPNLTFLYISYRDLIIDSKYWLVFFAVVYIAALFSCFIGSYLTEVIRREKAVVRKLNALRQAAFEGEFSQLITDVDGVIVKVNRYLAEKMGLTTESMMGKKMTDFGHSSPSFESILQLAKNQGSWLGEISIHDSNGATSIQQMTVTAVYADQEIKNYVCSSIDISAQKSLERKLQRLANTDPLTGVSNRRHFEHSVYLEQSRSDRNGSRFTILMLDVDHFKQLNDKHGHDVGDLCLIRLVEKVNELKRETDLLARWGGEEFIMLLPETDVSQALNLAERLRLSFENDLNDPSFTCSFGLSENQKDSSFAKLYKQADSALYQAKSQGRNQVVLYVEEAKNS